MSLPVYPPCVMFAKKQTPMSTEQTQHPVKQNAPVSSGLITYPEVRENRNNICKMLVKSTIFAVQLQKPFNMSQATISIRVDQSLKQSFDSLCEDFGISTTAAFNIFMKTVVRERRIPFEIRSESEEQRRLKAMDTFAAMRASIAAAGVPEMTLEEINEEIREVRNARHK